LLLDALVDHFETLHLAEHTELFALFSCQIGMLFSVGEATSAYYWQDQEGYVDPVHNPDYHPSNTAHMGELEWQKLRSARWSPDYRMKSPAAAGANLCYIACGAAIVVLPNLSGTHNSDALMLLAFNLIFLGLESFSYHYDGEVLNDWSHRADLTFIMVVVGALPFLALDGLWKAYNGKESPPRDGVALITKGLAIALGGYSFVFQPELYSMAFLLSMGTASVIINNLSTVLMTRRAVALTAKRSILHRWLRGYKRRDWHEWDVAVDDIQVDPALNQPNLDAINWNTWKWREADKRWCLGITCSHEFRSAIDLALPRFLLSMAIIGIGQLVNTRSEIIRDEGWGDKNVTAQWAVDQEMYASQGENYIATAIERRKVYDYMHGSWQFLSALFLMKQTLGINIATTGRIEDLNIYAGRAETFGVGQSWAIVVAVYLAWQLEASSTAWAVLWCVAALPGSILSAWLLWNRQMKLRRQTAQYPSRSRRPTGNHLGDDRSPSSVLAESLLAPDGTGPGSPARSRSPPPHVSFIPQSGGLLAGVVSREKLEPFPVCSFMEESDSIQSTRFSKKSRSVQFPGTPVLESSHSTRRRSLPTV
jgi:hypothetical protein